MYEALRMTPVDRTNYLGRPPLQIALRDPTLIRTRFKHVPQASAFRVAHEQIQMRGRLECAEKVWCPLSISLPCPQQYVAFQLW